jgi:tRNA-guanine family transglycosylase
MRFYVSWYSGDPWYPDYEDDCAMLISVTSVSQTWTLRDPDNLPKHLILDSGGYRYARYPDQTPTPIALFQRQLDIVAETPVPTLLCSLDFPILDDGLSQPEKDACINQTIAHAYEFKSLLSKLDYPSNVRGLAIVQGYDLPSLQHCAKELKSIGFQHFGLGSLAPLRHHEKVMRRVEAVVDVVGKDLHVFGIGAIDTLHALQRLGIRSVDTSRPAKSAMYNQVFFSQPFIYYAIAASQDKSGLALSEERRLQASRPCDCPICKGQVNPDIIKLGKRKYVFARTLHNYWHLKRTVN